MHDPNIVGKIVDAIDPQPDDRLVEIGPGRGALTYPLLRRCRHLVAIELDRDLIPALERATPGPGRLEVINADILEFDLASLGGGQPIRLVGNLPYNISTPLLFHLLESASLIRDMHFMLQKEVAQRIVAHAGERNYGRLSVMLQFHCDCHYLFDVAPGCFSPPPRVDSAVIRLVPLAAPRYDIGDYHSFSTIVQTAFNQRRKTVANSLKPILERERIAACGVDPSLRAENLDLADFASLSRALCR